MNNTDELVFAVPTDWLWKLIPYKKQGLITSDSEILKTLVQNGLFRKRSELEEDSSCKQIIPYGVITCKNSYYLFKRTGGQTDKRLPNLFFLGAGGHMNRGKSAGSEERYLLDELKRELFEEVRLTGGCVIENTEFIGFINDDTITVGRFHIGLLYHIRVSNKVVYVNETDKMTAEWIDKTSLAEFYEGMETWSKMVFDFYIKDKYL
jgi:predicted NUDIX family phosphoesterase